MKKQNKKYFLILLIIGLIIISFVIYKIFNQNQTMIRMNIRQLYDYSTNEKLIGASDYVFVGKVNKILRTEHKIKDDNNSSNQTIYSVSVIKNIKRKLITSSEIELNLFGGWDQNHETLYLPIGMNLLNENEYYIFFAYLDKDQSPLTINNKLQLIKLGKNYDKNSQIIKDIEKAYKNEEVPSKKDYMIPKELFTSKYDQINK